MKDHKSLEKIKEIYDIELKKYQAELMQLQNQHDKALQQKENFTYLSKPSKINLVREEDRRFSSGYQRIMRLKSIHKQNEMDQIDQQINAIKQVIFEIIAQKEPLSFLQKKLAIQAKKDEEKKQEDMNDLILRRFLK